MKTAEELKALKNEVETLNRKLAALTEDDLEQVTGGIKIYKENQKCPFCGQVFKYLSPYHLMECVKKNS